MQEAPFTIQVEPVQGCNLGCDFCGIHAIGYQQKKRGLDVMDLATAQSLADQIKALGWNPRIEFAMHGEPTLHPQLDEMISIFREALPKAYLMVTSNGGGLLKDTKETVLNLFMAGLNTLALDDYESNQIVQRVLENMGGGPLQVVNYPEDGLKWSPHTRHTGRRIVIIKDISSSDAGTHATLNNHAGSSFPQTDAAWGKRCAKPFRELSVRWDGNVAICCNDWPGVFKVGNVLVEGLDAVWQSARLEAARKALYHGRRDLVNPCHGCDATSYRVGLLPDKMGKETLEEPTEDDLAVLAEAASGEAYTVPVRGPLPPVTIPLNKLTRNLWLDSQHREGKAHSKLGWK